MKTIIELPSRIEVESVTYDEKTRTLEIEHSFVRGQQFAPVANLTCVGRGGKEAKFSLLLNGRRGSYVASDRSKPATMVFDEGEAGPALQAAPPQAVADQSPSSKPSEPVISNPAMVGPKPK